MIVTPAQQPRWNAILVETLRVFIQICEKHHLRYFAVGGTAIGAVRHRGMIPWDDDIDVCMPRPDYERFIAVFSEADYPDYELLTPYNTKNFPIPSLKLCDKRTTLVEDDRIPFRSGLYIDILPVDGTADDRVEAVRLFHKYQKIKNRINAISYRSSFGEHLALLLRPGEWGRFVYKTIGFLARPWYRAHLLRQLREISLRHPFDAAQNVLVYSGSYGDREVYPKEWIRDVVYREFEGLQLALPIDYDAYLSRIFGSYMQLPPEEKRVGKHSKAYFNMDARVSLEEALAKAREAIS